MLEAVLHSYLYTFRQLPKKFQEFYTKFFIGYMKKTFAKSTAYKHFN